MKTQVAFIVALLFLVLGAEASIHTDDFAKFMGRREILRGTTPKSAMLKQNQFWFDQLIDHFNPEDRRTFKQKYYVTDQFWDRENGPVILYICGEGPCSGVPEKRLFISTLAEQNKAVVLSLEHRFYGVSQPFKDLSTENLRYLTVEQALEDLAHFIHWVKTNSTLGIGENRKWMTYGGSYPGALSAWFRYKYPHLTAGAVASSAVINVITDFGDYDHQIYLSALKSGKWCTDRIQELIKYVEGKLDSDPVSIKKEFKAEKLTDLEFLYYYSDSFSGMVQYGQRVQMCDLMRNDSFQERYDNLKQAIMGNNPEPYSAEYVRNDTWWPERDPMRQWTWQTCIDMGWFQSAYHNASESLRSSRLTGKFFLDFCEQVFGKGYIPDEKLSNSKRGGLKLDVSNLIMVNGCEDPWLWASRTEDFGNVIAYTIDCEGCAHCVDIKTPDEKDSWNLWWNRQKISYHVSQWFKN